MKLNFRVVVAGALWIGLTLCATAASAASKKTAAPTFNVTYSGEGSIVLRSQVRQPSAGACNITESTRAASISEIKWETVWNRVTLRKTGGKAAAQSAIAGRGSNSAKNIYNLSGCTSGYSVNDCRAPSVCEFDAGSCSEQDLYQTPGYPIKLEIVADSRKKGRWIVTISAEEAAFSPCASGVINNSFFEESPTSVKFLVTAASRKKTSRLSPALNADNLDCAESVPGLEYACQVSFNFSTSINVTGNVTATLYK